MFHADGVIARAPLHSSTLSVDVPLNGRHCEFLWHSPMAHPYRRHSDLSLPKLSPAG